MKHILVVISVMLCGAFCVHDLHGTRSRRRKAPVERQKSIYSSINDIHQASQEQLHGFNNLLAALSEREVACRKEQDRIFDQKVTQTVGRFQKQMNENFHRLSEFKERLLEAERRMQERVAEIQNTMQKNMKKRFKDIRAENEKKHLALFDERLSVTVDRMERAMAATLKEVARNAKEQQETRDKEQLSMFGQKLRESCEAMQVRLQKEIEAVVANAEKRHVSDHEKLVNQYAKLFDVKLGKAESKLRKNFDVQLQKLTQADARLIDEKQKNLVVQCTKLFDEKLSMLYENLKKQAEAQVKSTILADKQTMKNELDVLKKNLLDTFNKRLQVAQNKVDELVSKNLEAIKVNEAKKTNKVQEVMINEQERLFRENLKMTANKIEKHVVGKLQDLTTKEQARIDVKCDELSKKYVQLFSEKLDTERVFVKSETQEQFKHFEQKHKQELEQERKSLNQQYTKLFDEKLLTAESSIHKNIDQKFKKLLLKKEEVYKSEAKKQRDEILAFTVNTLNDLNKRFEMVENETQRVLGAKIESAVDDLSKDLDGKLVENSKFVASQLSDMNNNFDNKFAVNAKRVGVVEQKLADNVKFAATQIGDVKKELSVQVTAVGKDREIFEKECNEFVNTQIDALQTKFVHMHDQLKQETEKRLVVLHNRSETDRAARKKNLDSISSQMLHLLEARLNQSTKQNELKMKKEFAALFEKLQNINKNYAGEVEGLNKRLAEVKKQLMEAADRKKKITQAEIDNIVRYEVGKRMDLLNSKKDPRVNRLKKVVVLEKMREILKGIVENDESQDVEF